MTISLSNTFAGGVPSLAYWMFSNSWTAIQNIPSSTGFFLNNDSSIAVSLLYIMKGTVPTNFSTLININARASDILCNWKHSAYGYDDFLPGGSTVTTNPIVINTVYKNATVSDTATWFWFMAVPASSSIAIPTAAPWHQMFGTVGTIGSGADMEMTSTNIVTGNAYAITGFRIAIPTAF